MERIALFGVDPQNDFGHPQGTLYCEGGFKIVGGGMVLVEHGLISDWKIMFSADDHPHDSEHFKKWPPHCVSETWGARFLNGIRVPDRKNNIFFKGVLPNENGYDPFDGTNDMGQSLEQVLKECNVTKLIVWGIATNYCIRAFVLTARKKGYEVFVVLDACAAVPTPLNMPPDFVTEEQAIEDTKRAGAIMTTVKEVISGKLCIL